MEIAKLCHVVADGTWDFFEISAIELVKKRFAISRDRFTNNILAAVDAVVDSVERLELIVECDLHYSLLYIISGMG